MALMLVAVNNQAFAEVTSIQSNDESLFMGDSIEFSGTVEKGSTGLVTIVIRDTNNEFVLLSQAVINHDDTFEKNVIIDNRFVEQGVYTGTGFILNMTKGITTDFVVGLNQIPKTTIIENIKEIENIKNEQISIIETEKNTKLTENKIADFIDSSKDPYHYIERYYSEPKYKSWFDRNYPNLTIEDAVGHTYNGERTKSKIQQIIDNQIIPEAQASSIIEPVVENTDNSDIAQITLAITGLGILFGAVYGVKRQVDNNSRQISINKDTIRKKIIRPIRGSNPKEILQMRLAKGEITLEEFEKLKLKLI